jgi:hypothetical protein
MNAVMARSGSLKYRAHGASSSARRTISPDAPTATVTASWVTDTTPRFSTPEEALYE